MNRPALWGFGLFSLFMAAACGGIAVLLMQGKIVNLDDWVKWMFGGAAVTLLACGIALVREANKR